jgi:hypothetical protein
MLLKLLRRQSTSESLLLASESSNKHTKPDADVSFGALKIDKLVQHRNDDYGASKPMHPIVLVDVPSGRPLCL